MSTSYRTRREYAFTPPPEYTQDELRNRRRKRLTHVYGGAFSLADEVDAIVSPLAQRVAAQPRPLAFKHGVEDVVNAVCGAVSTIATLLIERDAHRRTAHLPVSARAQAEKALVTVAQRPVEPHIEREDVIGGEWAAVLVEYADAFTAPLADYLGNARPPGTLRGLLSVSERLEAVLREIDSAAMSLGRKISQFENARGDSTPSAPDDADAARQVLDDLGIPH
ncbi:hypothetical protein [Gordonia sp. NPDC003422]